MSEESDSDDREFDEEKFQNWLNVFFDRPFQDPLSAFYRRAYLAAYMDGHKAACLEIGESQSKRPLRSDYEA
jgi:hypothetical protein